MPFCYIIYIQDYIACVYIYWKTLKVAEGIIMGNQFKPDMVNYSCFQILNTYLLHIGKEKCAKSSRFFHIIIHNKLASMVVCWNVRNILSYTGYMPPTE